MLEEITIKYIDLSTSSPKGMAYGLTILGAIVAPFFDNYRSEMQRAPYFANSALIFLLISIAQIVWLHSVPAMAGGYLWVLAAISAGANIVGGYFFAKIAMARSRDAYGHSSRAFLAFIPFANLWLLLTPSQSTGPLDRPPTIRIMRGGLGVLTGFFMFLAGIVITAFLEVEADRIGREAETNTSIQRVGIDYLLRSQGLEKTISELANAAQTPIVIDEITTLTKIEAAGDQLRRTYVITREMKPVWDRFKSNVTNNICAHGPFISLLRSDATIREIFLRGDGTHMGAILVTRDVCGI